MHVYASMYVSVSVLYVCVYVCVYVNVYICMCVCSVCVTKHLCYVTDVASCVGRKATRCYQKAFELDNDNQEAGAGLIDCLLASEEKASHSV